MLCYEKYRRISITTAAMPGDTKSTSNWGEKNMLTMIALMLVMMVSGGVSFGLIAYSAYETSELDRNLSLAGALRAA